MELKKSTTFWQYESASSYRTKQYVLYFPAKNARCNPVPKRLTANARFSSRDIVLFHTTTFSIVVKTRLYSTCCWQCYSCHNRRTFWLVKTEWKSQKNFNSCVIYAKKVNIEFGQEDNDKWIRLGRMNRHFVFFCSKTTRTFFFSHYFRPIWVNFHTLKQNVFSSCPC